MQQSSLIMRRGPKPLPVHIGLSLTSLLPYGEALPGYAQIQAEAMEKILAGVRQYHHHPYRRTLSPLPVIWKKGLVSICRASGAQANAPTVLLVPSLINMSDILDLIEGRSLVRYLAEQGINACLLDWGVPTDDPGQKNVDLLISERLIPALRFLMQETGGPVRVFGYCMGGTLLAAAASHAPECIKSMTFFAAPWDFHAGNPALRTQIGSWMPTATTMLAEKGTLEAGRLQAVFAAIDPQRAVQKFSCFETLPQDSPEAALFVAVEDWLNEGMDLPGDVARACLDDWYIQNLPGRGAWVVNGRTTDLSTLNRPCLIVAAEKDKIAPPESCVAIQTGLPHAKILRASCGHVGLIAGRDAIPKVWEPLAAFLKK